MKKRVWTLMGAAVGMLVLILDTKTAMSGAQDGIRLCLTAVIPSLLPFFFLSILLTDSLVGSSPSFLRILGRVLRIPAGSESIFLIGALGGYPTGAVCISKSYADGSLSRRDGERMLGFCSNAGPAFLFGIASGAFSQMIAPWALWCFHLLGAIAAAITLPGDSRGSAVQIKGRPMSTSQALNRSLTIMARVCGWILLFRILIAFCNRWFLWYIETPLQVLFSGLLELTIGCTELQNIQCEGLRFILCSAMLSLGGICVAMQTVSAVGTLGLGMYIPGKLIQCFISTLAAAIFQQFVFPSGQRIDLSPATYLLLAASTALLTFGLKIYEKKCSNSVPVGV